MIAQRRKPSRRLVFVCAVSAMFATSMGTSVEAQVAVDDNVQSRLSIYTEPLFAAPSAISPVQQLGYDVCISPGKLIRLLYHDATRHRGILHGSDSVPESKIKYLLQHPDELVTFFSAPANRKLATQLVREYFISHPEIARKEWQLLHDFLLYQYLRPVAAGEEAVAALIPLIRQFGLQYPLNFCSSAATTLKVSFPLNPTYETNVLKSNLNNSPGTSFGFGGSMQIVGPGLRQFDLAGISVQDQSVRYGQPFVSKSFDAATLQAAYQFFIDAYARDLDGAALPMNGRTPPEKLAPANMITVDTIAIGFQNQTTYSPLFRLEQANLFTPLVSFNHINMPLFGGFQCTPAIPDPSRNGYCYYADVSVTVGQTYSDVSTQENANLTVAVTPGWRVDGTDWTVTLPTTVTARDYEHVAGGRRDVLLQVGPTLTYAPASFVDSAFIAAVTFKLSVTYNQNYSTIPIDAWHGIIVMPTLSIAFAP